MADIKIMSWNLSGLTPGQLRNFLQYCASLKPPVDVVVLQGVDSYQTMGFAVPSPYLLSALLPEQVSQEAETGYVVYYNPATVDAATLSCLNIPFNGSIHESQDSEVTSKPLLKLLPLTHPMVNPIPGE